MRGVGRVVREGRGRCVCWRGGGGEVAVEGLLVLPIFSVKYCFFSCQFLEDFSSVKPSFEMKCDYQVVP